MLLLFKITGDISHSGVLRATVFSIPSGTAHWSTAAGAVVSAAAPATGGVLQI